MTMLMQLNYVKVEKDRFIMLFDDGLVFDDNLDAVELYQNRK